MLIKNANLLLKSAIYFFLFSLMSCKEKSISKGISSENTAEISVISLPFKNIEIPFSEYYITAGKDTAIQTSSGTKIILSANSLIDKNGNEIKGPIKLKYREFMDPAEIMTSGIPMEFKSRPGSLNKCFQSAGMFELLAESNNHSEVFIDNNSPIKVNLATNNTGEGYSNFYLNKKTGDWIYSGEENKKPNQLKLNLNKQIRQLKEITAFNGKDYFALNAIGLLDAFFDDEYGKILPYYNEKNRPMPNKLLRYGIKSKEVYTYDYVNIGRNQYPAAMVIWENTTHKSFPAWTKGSRAELKHISDNNYELSVMQVENKVFTIRVKAVMSMKSMMRFSPEHWATKHEETMEVIKKQEETLAKMKDIYRLLEVNAFGIHNCDKFYSNPDAFAINAKIILPKSKTNFKPDRMFYISLKDKVSIDYKIKDVVKMTIYPDNTASLYTVLENNMLARVGPEFLRKLNRAQNENKEIEFEFKAIKKINSLSEFRRFVGI